MCSPAIIIRNLVEDPPDDAKPIGRRMTLEVVEMVDGVAWPRFRLAE